MRTKLLGVLVSVALAACSSGTPGEQGPQGPQGATGPAGAVGPQGPQGMTGPKGDTGDVGPMGAPGADGPQGIAGPPGQVLVVDGGVVVGPAGASVVVTPITVGTRPCLNGGVRITQLSDGGITSVCNGTDGADGATGPTGATGPAGPIGPQGLQGVPGFAVSSSPLAMMSPQCPTGGVLLGFADGGTSAICNGAQGVQGAQGIQGVAGPMGPTGLQGPAGATGGVGPAGPAGPTGVTGPTGATGPQGPAGVAGPAGPTGAQGLQGVAGPAGATGPAGPTGAQGTQGVAGPTGATGPAGPAGPAGPTGPTGTAGPSGPPGAVVLLDGGVVVTKDWVTLAGFTASTYTGNLGGRVGAHAVCNATFAGSHFCDENEYTLTNSDTPIPAGGAWIDDWDSAAPGARGSSYLCNRWTNGTTSYEGMLLTTDGTISTSYVNTSNYGCGTARAVACCFASVKSKFRGFTGTTYTGALGGRVGAHAICNATFPGSHFCHEGEYLSAYSPTAVPTGGAWVDDYNETAPGKRGSSYLCNGWNNGTTSYEGMVITVEGTISTSYVNTSNYGCGTPRPVACCE